MQMEIGEFFEGVNDALKAAVLSLGGFKKVGGIMRPELAVRDAEAWIRHCLDASRREKLDPDQVMFILREARKVGFHTAFDFIAADAGYKAKPVDLEHQVQSMEATIAAGVDLLNKQMASLQKMRERTGS